ncbi:MAG: hypothetical protein EOO74_05005 [Myxococcales bacterium]|nr:MAG: hypothetical protein EOO74_05005 [Myxococcales bacterium]
MNTTTGPNLGSFQILVRRGQTLLAGICYAPTQESAEEYAERTVHDFGERARVESVAPWFGPQAAWFGPQSA